MITLIVNPTAGTGLALKVTEQLKAALTEKRIPFRIWLTERPGHATELARKAAADPECGAVWSVGGDGTGFETACGMAGTGKPFGMIPAGTGNDFIKSLQTPREPMAAMDFILSHEPRPVDIGVLNGGSFLNVCGTGFDVTVLDYAASLKARFKGLTPYLLGLIKAIRHARPFRVTLEVDGERLERELMICTVANGRFIGGGIPICPAAEPGDGLLDLVMVRSQSRLQIVRRLPGLLTGRILNWSITEHRLCREVRILDSGLRYNVDGEILSMDAPCFGVRPGGLLMYW